MDPSKDKFTGYEENIIVSVDVLKNRFQFWTKTVIGSKLFLIKRANFDYLWCALVISAWNLVQ